MSSEQEILRFLKRKEKELAKTGTSAREFAKMIGTSDTHWILTRQGKVKLGEMVASGAGAAFPELMALVTMFLVTEKPNRERKTRRSNKSAEVAS